MVDVCVRLKKINTFSRLVHVLNLNVSTMTWMIMEHWLHVLNKDLSGLILLSSPLVRVG